MVITGRERVLLPYTTITIQFLDLGIIHSFIHLFYITECLHLIPKRFYAIRNVCRLVFVTLVSFSLFVFMICIVPTSWVNLISTCRMCWQVSALWFKSKVLCWFRFRFHFVFLIYYSFHLIHECLFSDTQKIGPYSLHNKWSDKKMSLFHSGYIAILKMCACLWCVRFTVRKYENSLNIGVILCHIHFVWFRI